MFGFVYIIKAGNYYKIGKTKKSIKNRIKILQTGCPYKMVLVAAYYGNDYSKIEKELHTICSKFGTNIHLEWFRLNDIIDFFKTIEIDYEFGIDYTKLNNFEI